MKKIRNLIAVAAAVLAAMIVTVCVTGCSGGGKILGTWSINACDMWDARDQYGVILRYVQNENITISDDGTYVMNFSSQWTNTVDGIKFKASSGSSYVAYGTYEVTNEDTDLNEKTIKILTMDRIVGKGGVDSTDAALDAETKESLDKYVETAVGKEVILDADYYMSEFVTFWLDMSKVTGQS